MKRLGIAAIFLGAALSACGPSAIDNFAGKDASAPLTSAMEERAVMDAPAAEAVAPAAAPMPPPPPGQPPVPGTPPGGVMLAYAYQTSVEVPSQRVTAVMKTHEDKCVKAGPAVCQVLGSSTNAYGENDIRAQLNLRAEPRWLETFRLGLAGDAEKAGGKLTAESVTTEDLTRALTDTEARLRAARTLRDRLQALLASRPGRLSDLLDVERELARVQGDIDSTESNLAVMRARVSMSTLTLDYMSAGAPVTDTTFQPIKEALVEFLRRVAEGFAAMITLVAVIVPWALALWLIVWLFKLWRKRAAAAKAAKKAAAETA